MLLSIVAFLFIILVCVLVHEFGHYITAVFCGVKVHEFSFGMGPLVWQKQGKYNKWSVRAFPIGGFVRLAGMGEENDGEKLLPGESFSEKAPWKKLIILAAGAFNNILLAILIATFLLMSRGVMDLSVAKIGELMTGFPAEQAGLQVGDVITTVGGVKVSNWEDMTTEIRSQAAKGGEVSLTVKRGKDNISLKLGTKNENPEGPPLIGIRPAIKKLGLIQALRGSVYYAWYMMKAMLQGLKELITRPSQVEVSGPVGIAAMAGQAAHEGFYSLLMFLTIISLNLGVINLLPIPALDGGHILFALCELISRRRIPLEFQGKINYIGFILLIALIILVTGHDVIKLIVH